MKSLHQYADVREVLDVALEKGGIRYTLPSPTLANEWRHRAYALRKILRGGNNGASPYDALTIRLAKDSSTCRIEVLPKRSLGVIEEIDEDPLVEYVRAIANR